MITRIWRCLLRQVGGTNLKEPDTLTRLPIPGSIPLRNAEMVDRGRVGDTIAPRPTRPEAAGDDELAVRAHLFLLLGVGGPR